MVWSVLANLNMGNGLHPALAAGSLVVASNGPSSISLQLFSPPEELSASVCGIARSAGDASRVAGPGLAVAQSTAKTASKLGQSSAEIVGVVKIVTSIAQQANLSALNQPGTPPRARPAPDEATGDLRLMAGELGMSLGGLRF